MTQFQRTRYSIRLASGVVSRFVSSFHPNRLHPRLRRNYARELISWAFTPVMLAGIQQGAIGVILVKSFTGLPGTTDRTMSLAVGTVGAAAAIGNLSSTVWASVSRGRSKVALIVSLLVACSLCVAAVGVVPASNVGMWMLVGLVLLGWVLFSGVITIRTTVWRNNYPGSDRTIIAGRLASVQAIALAIAGLVVGFSLDRAAENSAESSQFALRIIFPVLGAFGLIGAANYARVRLRGGRRLARAERKKDGKSPARGNPFSAFSILRTDRSFARYMGCQFVLGMGNLMLMAPLTLVLTEQFDVSYLTGILLLVVIPLVCMPITIPAWARMLTRMHVISFRAIHSWFFVLAGVLFGVATFTGILGFMVAGAIVLGTAFGGGVLAWNLGHQHFATKANDAEYMSVHVTLTGIRGIIAPYLGVLLYQSLAPSGEGFWVFALSVALTTSGAIGFLLLRRSESR